MSTVSVVIPSLNDSRMLRQCLADLAAQTSLPDEIIVVDNGSTDDTAQVAVAAGAIVVNVPERGVLRATAAGFDAARFDVIGRLDADSRPAPDWVARLRQRFDADATLMALTGTGTFYGCGPVLRVIGKYVYLGGYFGFMGSLVGHLPLFGSNMALRRVAWLATRDRVHLHDPHMHDDLDISFVIEPSLGIEFDGRLLVGVSARPFTSFAGLERRVTWAFHDVRVNMSEVSWPRRVWRGFRGRRARRRDRRINAESARAARQ
ncbi:glycosyltransferase family A protein [Humibacter ginsenosidimutans]|uniref:4,4'-diaponeurosporenoate glycosyltransferase n=1 Tax=Humibacter ginsenosidimutans TaxID=2599293 RepID=A0A5B8M3M6_9MICO|nr:glycosyltransferase family A protein [Humibacter ginsenosidimutans]QDZ14544.1 glycosyltransferase family 2 protein [Humibacter ginsenosidimutans]